MANTIYRASDAAPIEVFTTAAFPTTEATTDWIDVRGFTHIDFIVALSSGQTITDLKCSVYFRIDEIQANPPIPLMVEEYDAGPPVVSRQAKYTVDAPGVFAGANGRYALSVPVAGLQMRLGFLGGPSAGTDQARVFALRRTS
jgi:hypothetical protein